VDLEEHGNELSTLKGDREKTLHTLAEMQVAMSDKTKQLSSANDAIADLRLKLSTLEKSLEDSRAREKALSKDLQDEKNLLKSAAATQVDYEKWVEIWTERLVDAVEKLTAQLSTMGVPNFKYSSEERISSSARLTMFFESIIDALKLLQSNRATQLANESRKLCRAILRKVLVKVVYNNPGVDLTNVLDHLPKDADLRALEELVAPSRPWTQFIGFLMAKKMCGLPITWKMLPQNFMCKVLNLTGHVLHGMQTFDTQKMVGNIGPL
jgi:hypothetical protein